MTATAELAIRARRAAFNQAIADGNAAAIGSMLARDCIMVTGSDSAVIAGRNAQVKVWAREFAARRRLVYTRTPGTIIVSPAEPIALEQGEWQGVETSADGSADALTVSGVYTAKWRESSGHWLIEAEIFVTMA